MTKKDDIVGIRKKDDDIINTPSSGYLSSETELEEYQPFDDWIEMIIQFGDCSFSKILAAVTN